MLDKIALIAMVYNRPASNVDQWGFGLSRYRGPYYPDEIILVDQSDHNINLDNGVICRDYGFQHVYCPRDKMNMSNAFNLGIKMSGVETDYVLMTGIDWLFSPNFFEILRGKLAEDRIVQCLGGYLPQGFDVRQDWIELVLEAEKSEISRRLSPGVCQCVSKYWALKVHGYDERFPAQDGVDDDFRCRAIKAGLESVWVEWTEAQACHMWHERSPLKGVGSSLFSGDAPVVANLKGWGEYAGS